MLFFLADGVVNSLLLVVLIPPAFKPSSSMDRLNGECH